MNLTYEKKYTKITPIEVGIKEDIGLSEYTEFTLFNNNVKIGDFYSKDEDVTFTQLQSVFLHKLLENGKLPQIMKEMDKIIPDKEFFTQICEDDYYIGTVHDIRNPELVNFYEVRQRGKDVHMTYFFFLKKHWNELNEIM